jgi:hypothetical protein
VVASRLHAVHAALHTNEESWFELLQRAMAAPNNLVYWRVKSTFLAWCKEHSREAQLALLHLWDEPGSLKDRVDRFKTIVSTEVCNSRPARH